MSLPKRNATVLSIAGAGEPEDFDEEATAGSSKFAAAGGTAGAGFYTEKRRRVSDGAGGLSIVVERSLVLPTAAPAAELEAGDVVRMRVERRQGEPEEVTAEISDVELRAIPDVGSSTRITFAPA